MFYYKIPWFYQDFKNKNPCFFNLYSVHAERTLRDHVKSSQMRNETLYNSKGFPFMMKQV